MSKISLIYDDLHEVIQELLPDHKELINPYVPEDSDNLHLEMGWGVTILEGSNARREIPKLTMSRSFELLLTRKVFGADLRKESAMNKRKTAEKALFEDQIVIAKHMQSNTYLKSVGFTNASRVMYESDDGLNFLRNGDTGILLLRSIIAVEYDEALDI